MICQPDYGYEVRARCRLARHRRLHERLLQPVARVQVHRADPVDHVRAVCSGVPLGRRREGLLAGVEPDGVDAGRDDHDHNDDNDHVAGDADRDVAADDHDDDADRSDGSQPAADQRADESHRDDDQRAPVPHTGLGHGLPAQLWLTRSALGLAAWLDVGGFTSECSNPSPGYKFIGLNPSTTYVLSVRAYHLVGGVKVYSPEASLTTSTLEATTLAPTTVTTTTTTLPPTTTTAPTTTLPPTTTTLPPTTTIRAADDNDGNDRAANDNDGNDRGANDHDHHDDVARRLIGLGADWQGIGGFPSGSNPSPV